jgi:hypothetical protein
MQVYRRKGDGYPVLLHWSRLSTDAMFYVILARNWELENEPEYLHRDRAFCVHCDLHRLEHAGHGLHCLLQLTRFEPYPFVED